jgi:diguanylate cyclase (GGDEF)-like protein
MNFNVLPSLVALAILVGVFWAILRAVSVERLHLWLAGWILVLVHFGAQFLGTGPQPWDKILLAISLNALELASLAFMISMSEIAYNPRRQLLQGAILGIPAILFTNAVVWDVSAHGFYYAVIAVALVASFWLIWSGYRTATTYVISILLALVVFSGIVAWTVAKGKLDWSIDCILATFNFVVAVLYWRRFARTSAGVLTTVFGFVAWGAVFPLSAWMSVQMPGAHVESEVWNIPKYFVAVGMILTLLEDQISRSDYLAYHDELTGLPNRRLLDDRLQQAIIHARRNGHQVAVLLIDLDRFKEINDTYGHRIGDIVLREVVVRLASRMRAADTLARSGGDEFTVISEVTDAHGADVLISALESALLVPLKVEGHLVSTGMSIGAALYPDHGANPDELCAAADRAMYIAKRGNRTAENVIAFPQSPM